MSVFQQRHEQLPQQTHDEFAREEFCGSLRKMFTTELWPANREVYTKERLPSFVAEKGRAPQTFPEVREWMEDSFYYRSTNAVGRAAQELLWDTVGESVERQLDTLIEKSKPRKGDLGTIRVNPDLKMPRYIEAVDIHVMPGNFQTDLGPDDVFAGALYDRGVYVFAFGGLGKTNADLGLATALFTKEKFPDFKPKRILDMGCGPGFTTLPWKDIFPDAEVYGIDIGAPQVRYGHGRAEALGKAIHYSQQDAAHTDFPDGYFDIVSSLLVTHEMPGPHIRAVYKECNRLLAPGGITLHDGGLAYPSDPFDILMNSWFGMHANEPFSNAYKTMDHDQAMIDAGFSKDKIFHGQREAVYLKGQLPPVHFVGAIKS